MQCVLSVVIINYQNYKVTIDCVNSLMKNNLNNVEIVIIDNGSKNDSFALICNEFKNKKIHVLKSKLNMGYSGGCNMGIEYSKRILNAKHVALLNSDLIFEDSTSIQKILSYLESTSAGVVNIALSNKDKTAQLPYGRFSSNILFELIRIYVYIFCNFIFNFLHINRRKKKSNIKEKKYIINGPAFCLTSAFFEKYNYLFEKNFLYLEEFNLYLYLKKANLSSVTNNFGSIIHLECQSDVECMNVSNKKLKRIFASSFKSCKLVFKSRKKIVSKYSNIKGKYDAFYLGDLI